MTLRRTPAELVAEAERQGQAGLVAAAPGWPRVPLDELTEITNGAAYASSHFNIEGRGQPLIRIRDVGASQVSTWYDGDWDPQHVVVPGDLLVGMDGDFRALPWRLESGLLNQRVCRIRVTDTARLLPSYLRLALQGYLDLIWRATSATTVKHLSSRSIQQIPLALPGTREQQRIVELVEEHLSHLDAADSSIDHAKYRVSGLIDNVLTIWRDRNTTGMTPLGAIASTQLGKMLDAKKAAGQPVPYLANINVRWGEFDLRDLRTVLLTEPEREKFSLQPGDLLLCEGGEPGRGAVWKGEVSNVAFQKALHRVRVTSPDRWRPEFVAAMIREGIRRHRWDHLFTGTTIKHLPQEKLRLLEIPEASMEQQDLLLDKVRGLEDHVARLQQSVTMNQQRSAALRRAVLAAAFSGRLTVHTSDSDVIEELTEVVP